MNYLLRNYMLILFSALLFLPSCKKEEPLRRGYRNIDTVKADFDAFTIKTGSQNYTLEYLNNQWWRFNVIAPKFIEGVSYPLIFNLHGALDGAEDAHLNNECYIKPGFSEIDAIIISPNDNNQLWTSMSNQEMVIKLLLFAQEFWPVDESKVVVTGYGNGGNGSWFYAETQPELFSAAIPMASSYSTIGTDGYPRVVSTPIFVIHGDEDELFPLSDTEFWVDRTLSVGSEVELLVAEGLDHTEPCNYSPYLKQAVTWLEEEVW